MRFFIDTEFIERGPGEPIELISLGIATENGVDFYGENLDFREERANAWVKENVLPHLMPKHHRWPLADMRQKALDFIVGEARGEKPEFWGYYCDYDWVVFCQMFGTMMDLSKGWPMYCRDIKQWADQLGVTTLPAQHSTEHNALNDARWNRTAFNYLKQVEESI